MITAVIIDDMEKNVLMLAQLLEQYCKQVTLLGAAGNIVTGKKMVEDLRPQLIFLDIEMPLGTGFDLLKSMPALDTEVIFITAHEQYALNAFRFAALDYLLKPLNLDQLTDAVNRAEKRINEKKTTRNYELWLGNLSETDINKQSLSLTENGQQCIVQLGDIMYLVADGSYTHVHTVGKMIVASRNLKEFETMFPSAIFARIHHGHMVNKNYVAKIQKGRGGTVVLKDGTKLEISVRRKDSFLKMFRDKL